MKFALYFGNRGFFPGELAEAARAEMTEALSSAGYEYILIDPSLTKYGAVETYAEGLQYEQFLKQHEGEYDGVILSLPNFGDENGAMAAFRECKVPILIQAYPDEIGKMDFENRRDAYCGKCSIMDVFYQQKRPFTIFAPHVCHPSSAEFLEQIRKFAGVCRVVKGMRSFRLGVIGARTTAFKTVRCDELTLQKYGIQTESFDLSELFDRICKFSDEEAIASRETEFRAMADFDGVPEEKTRLMAKTSIVIERTVEEWGLDAISLRCWNEFPQILGISACFVVAYLNQKGIVCSCETDTANVLAMRALALAAGKPSTVLDWNNNYGEEEDKCILFHCGPCAPELMEGQGVIGEHKMFRKSYGAGCAFGVSEGRLKPGPATFASTKTEDGEICFYVGQAECTGEPIEEAYFGAAGVYRVKHLEKLMLFIGRKGYRHHVGLAYGDLSEILKEAFEVYLGYRVEEYEC